MLRSPGKKWPLLLGVLLLSGTLSCKGNGGGGGSNKALDCTVAPATGTPRAALPIPDLGPCDLQGWCQEHPLPWVENLGPVWHRPDQSIITSGRGAVLRLREGVWESLGPLPEPPTLEREGQQHLHDIWAAGDFIYLTGSISIEGVVWIHDGETWSVHHFEDGFRPNHVWGTRESEVMVVGLGGARLWRDGAWEIHEPPRLVGQGVWGCEDTYFAATFQGSFLDEEALLARFENDSWSKTGDLPLVNVQFTGLSGTAEDDLFVSGTVNGASEEVAWHWDGSRWTDIDYGDSPGVYDIVALGDGRAVATGIDAGGGGSVKLWDGGAWTTINNGAYEALSVATPEDILGQGSLSLGQYDGEQWFEPFPFPNETPMRSENFTGVWSDGQDAWFLMAIDGSIYRREGEDWVEMVTPDAQVRNLNALWGSSATDVFVAGDRGLMWHYDGSAWSEMTLPSSDERKDYLALFGLGADQVWAAGDGGTVLFWDGVTWTRLDTSAEALTGVWAASESEVWAVGERGRVVHFDGVAWDDNTTLPGTNPRPVALWGSGSGDLWAAGGDTVWHHDGSSWSEAQLPTPSDLNALWGRSATDITVVGRGGTAFHFDGSGWSDIHAEHSWAFQALWGDANALRAVGALAIISVR